MNHENTEVTHLAFMALAVKCADDNLKTGNGGPFGAVVVKNGEVIAATPNSVTATNDPTAHAEVNAIREACKKLGTPDLEGCVMYTSCEPCPMCASAIYWAKISAVYYANTKADAHSAGFSDAFIEQELSKPLNERDIIFKRIDAADAIKSFEKWVALSEAEKAGIKNGTL
ncbi:nucleoside deaminase [Mucilaginibacter gynuensis]